MTILTVTLHPAIDRVLRTPRLQADEVARVQLAMLYGGGKGNNVARALTRLGVPVLATGFQGGYSGRFITDQLEAEGIPTSFESCSGDTRTSNLVQEEETGHSYALYEPGQQVTAQELERFLAHYEGLLPDVELVLLCGSGQTLELAASYKTMIALAEGVGKRVVVDSSGLALAAAVPAKPYMLKVNEHELAGYVKRPLDDRAAQIAAMHEIRAGGVPLVALSLGADGMLATDGAETWSAHLTLDNVVNVVGCGDSLLAGVAKTLLEGGELEELVRWGVACGTANTQVRGAGFIERTTVHELLPRVEVEPIAN